MDKASQLTLGYVKNDILFQYNHFIFNVSEWLINAK